MGLRIDYELVGSDKSFMRIRQQIAAQLYEDYYKKELKPVKDHPLIEDDDNHGVPHMNEVFYGLYGARKVIPSWNFFIDEYMKKWVIPNPNKGSTDPLWFGEYTFRSKDPNHHYGFDEPPLLKKLLRTYMSFLKEQHVMHWLFDKGLKSAYWSLESDNRMGFDIMVSNPRGKQYGIKVYSDTNRAKSFAAIKKHSRHAAKKEISSIAIPVPMNGERLGDTYVTPENILLCAYNLIMNGIETKTFTLGTNGQVVIEPGIILGGTYGHQYR